MVTCLVSRRRVLDLGVGAAATAMISEGAEAAAGATAGAQPGDALVTVGDAAHKPLTPGAVRRGAPPRLTWPMDPKTGLVRSGAKFNQVLLLRLMGDRDEAHGGPLVAFSAVCTHAGCIVSAWRAADRLLLCPCHGSQYDPARAAAVVAGPAPLPLPNLPLAVVDGRVTVAGAFSAPPGGHTGRTD
ncbi:ubiquinol-cytochrome c reductase iron-sulfur subunit [Acidisoma sp.]|uniref:QcrA and Rieske domain-containing protein n=1 Tax=Acidisoma sp. TaxID=1872115 RepID=UPI003AFF9C69